MRTQPEPPPGGPPLTKTSSTLHTTGPTPNPSLPAYVLTYYQQGPLQNRSRSDPKPVGSRSSECGPTQHSPLAEPTPLRRPNGYTDGWIEERRSTKVKRPRSVPSGIETCNPFAFLPPECPPCEPPLHSSSSFVQNTHEGLMAADTIDFAAGADKQFKQHVPNKEEAPLRVKLTAKPKKNVEHSYAFARRLMTAAAECASGPHSLHVTPLGSPCRASRFNRTARRRRMQRGNKG